MNLKKSTLSIALSSVLSTSASQAAVIDMDYSGLFTFLDPGGNVISNTSLPYYDDTTWGYGLRTQISGTLQYNSNTGYGAGTINPFELFSGNPGASVADFEYQSIGSGLMIGNMQYSWNNNNFTVQVVLDASGLFVEIASVSVGDVYGATSCADSGACATPGSDSISNGNYRIGPVPIATSTYNVAGTNGISTVLADLSLGTDDGIGGSPHTNGPTSGFSPNFDMTSLTVTNVSSVPVPAAFWLFGTGLIGLITFARCKK